MLKDFLDDGVVYLELRTTPRATDHISAEAYTEILIDTINDFEALHPDMHTRLILCVDRRHSVAMAESVLSLALQWQTLKGPGVVGIDLCGDPTARIDGEISMFTPIFRRAASNGLGITVHFAEAEASASVDELRTLLSWNPTRLGHVIWEDETIKSAIVDKKLCLELCLSCNVQAGMVRGGFEAHHFGYWSAMKGPKISLAVSLQD